MRQILFKAKRIDNGEWVEGAYFPMTKYPTKENHVLMWVWEEGSMGCDYDMGYTAYRVDENTICQYTGLTDKNGNKIWENDVVRIKYDDNFSEIGWIKYSNCGVRYYFIVGVEVYSFDGSCDVEVIGNIFDNPELMNETGIIGYADNGGLMSAT